ncbi:TonB-dependent receptor [Methylobacillus gramineus]|uniref:TonB-dependent receptor domain-containing protein n=1 Tax=Methylobacillus gramineus TaxID=755169 RepID=UPI001D000542|nr:TonB-dependent receptor [Methylobacillus gramineus]MCB5185146.1 TonB-dependent receptor [Methylobacillus gramineus]
MNTSKPHLNIRSVYAAMISLFIPGVGLSAEAELIRLEAIEVSAEQEKASRSLEPATVISGKELLQKSAATLGATLQDELGVANSTFGPNVGLPLIRGQHGPRTRVMINGVGTHDASAISPDHGTTVESLLAKEIKILRGPATIRNGGGAIGGAIEIKDGRIPESLPNNTKVTTQIRFNSNNDEKVLTSELLTKLNNLAFHADVHGRDSNNIQIPGYAINQQDIIKVLDIPSPSNTHGYTDNTNARSKGGSVGASYFGEQGYIGISLSQSANNYGIPLGPSHSHGGGVIEGAERVRIDMQQERIDLKGELFLDTPWLDSIALRVGKSRYQHDELNNGNAQTRFTNDVVESRLEFNHHIFTKLSGVLGFHGIHRHFAALGVEAFAPKTSINSQGVYLIETLDLKPFQLEFGYRKEQVKLDPDDQLTRFGPITIPVAQPKRDFSPDSFSMALGWTHQTGNITLNRWIARRAPDVQELYAVGPHLATRTYDFGNKNLDIETLNGWDIRVQQKLGKLDGVLNLFKYSAENYIYQSNTGNKYQTDAVLPIPKPVCTRLTTCLIVMQQAQQDAQFHGYELEVGLPLKMPGLRKFRASVFADQVRGVLDDGTYVPRLAPARQGLFIQTGFDQWEADLRYTHVQAQERTGTMIKVDQIELEPGTDSYNKIDIAIRRSVTFSEGFKGDFFINMRNITNAEVRNSTSFLRYYSPELGRNIEIGMRLDF